MAIDEPHIIVGDSFAEAWVAACSYLLENSGQARNLIIFIKSPTVEMNAVKEVYERFCAENDIIPPKHVACTIFPASLSRNRTAEELYDLYNRRGGFFDKIKKGWDTYFRRITHYPTEEGPVNQLSNIINAINNRNNVHKAAYTMIIQKPPGENIRPRGGPCLNYLALQIEPGTPKKVGLLAVYRNHDYLGKAYGNFLGLGQLLGFICSETRSKIGPLTCISSRGYMEGRVSGFRVLIEQLTNYG